MDAIRTPDEVLAGPPRLPVRAPLPRGRRAAARAHRRGRRRRPSSCGTASRRGRSCGATCCRRCATPATASSARTYVGFGRSDKPIDRDWYTYDRHCAMAATLLEDLDIRGATFVVPRLGRADRAAARGRARRARRPARDDGHRRLHRRRRWARSGSASAPSSTASRTCRCRRCSRAGRRPSCRDEVLAGYEKPFPNAGVEGRHARVPGPDPADARRARAPSGAGATLERLQSTDRGQARAVGRRTTSCCRRRSGRRSAAAIGVERRRRSTAPATSSRRTRARRSARSSPTG